MAISRKQTVIALAILFFVFLATRLILLANLPLFIDEAIYIKAARNTATGAYCSAPEWGKWLSIRIVSLFLYLPVDVRIAARLSSAMCGSISFWLMFLIGKELAGVRLGLVAVAFYVFVPYSLFYDRVVVMDAFTVAAMAGVVLFSLRLARKSTIGNQVGLGSSLIFAFLMKFSSIMLVFIPPLAVLTMTPRKSWGQTLKRIALPLLSIGALFVGWCFAGFLPHEIAEKTGGMRDLKGTVCLAMKNSVALFRLFWIMLTPPLFVIAALSALWSLLRLERSAARFLLLAAVGCVVPYILFARTWYPRYFLVALVPIYALMSCFILYVADWLNARYGKSKKTGCLLAIGCAVLLALPIKQDVLILAKPSKARLAPRTRSQFISGWTSGYGLPEMAKFLESEAARSKPDRIRIIRSNSWDHPFMGVDIYLAESDLISRHTFVAGNDAFLFEISRLLEDGVRTFFIFNAMCPYPRDPHILDKVKEQFDAVEVWACSRPGNKRGFKILELNQRQTQ